MSRRAEHPLFRATALVAVLGVLLLAIFSASPGWHAGLHQHEAAAAHGAPVGDANHVCAVTLMSAGVTALLYFCLLLLGGLPAAGIVWRARDETALAPPRYRLAPSRAPPAV